MKNITIESATAKIAKKLQKSGPVTDIKKPIHARTGRPTENYVHRFKCRTFADWIHEQRQVHNEFSTKIIVSDKAYFQLFGYVNKQNCRI